MLISHLNINLGHLYMGGQGVTQSSCLLGVLYMGQEFTPIRMVYVLVREITPYFEISHYFRESGTSLESAVDHAERPIVCKQNQWYLTKW